MSTVRKASVILIGLAALIFTAGLVMRARQAAAETKARNADVTQRAVAKADQEFAQATAEKTTHIEDADAYAIAAYIADAGTAIQCLYDVISVLELNATEAEYRAAVFKADSEIRRFLRTQPIDYAPPSRACIKEAIDAFKLAERALQAANAQTKNPDYAQALVSIFELEKADRQMTALGQRLTRRADAAIQERHTPTDTKGTISVGGE